MDRHVGGLDGAARGLLQQLQAQGFELAVAGDRLRIRPADRVTPELKDQLARHKAELLAALAPVNRHVVLNGGLIVPEAALALAWSLVFEKLENNSTGSWRTATQPYRP